MERIKDELKNNIDDNYEHTEAVFFADKLMR